MKVVYTVAAFNFEHGYWEALTVGTTGDLGNDLVTDITQYCPLLGDADLFRGQAVTKGYMQINIIGKAGFSNC